MSRTVTALYDTRAEAEAARERLQSQVDVEGRAQIIDKSSLDNEEGSSGFQRVPLSTEDRQAYGEGLNRGGFMLCAEVDGDEDADEIVSILEQTSSVDLDERQSAWRNEGWAGGETSAVPAAMSSRNNASPSSRSNCGSASARSSAAAPGSAPTSRNGRCTKPSASAKSM